MHSGCAELREILAPARLTAVVDVGANPVDGAPPYAAMLADGACVVTGFEPQPDALATLRARAGANERYLPYVVADGARHTLHVAASPGMTSLLEPDPSRLAMFNGFSQWGAVVDTVEVESRRLDDIAEIDAMDVLKMDVQGAEDLVLAGGRSRLDATVVVHTEVSFVPLYRGQPAIGDIDLTLRALGFIPHCFDAIKTWPLAPVVYEGDPMRPMRQLLEADVVYVRDPTTADAMSDEQLIHLALASHWIYGSSDLAFACLRALIDRGRLRPGADLSFLASAHPGSG